MELHVRSKIRMRLTISNPFLCRRWRKNWDPRRASGPCYQRSARGLRDFVFEPNSPPTHRALEDAVKRALVDWEPRIDVEKVSVVPDDDEPNLLLIQVDYIVRATNSFYNRVYPFYLLEGGA